MAAKKAVDKDNPVKKVSENKPRNFIQGRGVPVRFSRKRRGPLAEVWSFIIWLAGILVSLAVGFGMVGGTLTVPYITVLITAVAGWIVVILTLLGVLLKLVDVAMG